MSKVNSHHLLQTWTKEIRRPRTLEIADSD